MRAQCNLSRNSTQVDSGSSGNGVPEYEARLASEIDIYRDCTDVHVLPPIFHYWSERHVRPALERHGFPDPAGMFLLALENQCEAQPGAALRFLSAGSGNCDLEVGIAAGLLAQGYDNFVVECLDLNGAMLRRGAERARERGVAAHLEFVEADLNRWVAQRRYHAVIADQSLHHMVELESLFGQIGQALHPGGTFAISDMIGRNGHLRWPAALEIVREFWKQLPPSHRRNCRSGRYEAVFEDADCSGIGFEGIRAQDILRLLAENFHFRFFLGFGNVIDPFVDRSFGPHFDPAAAWDREFIDRVHARDEAEIAAGRLGPTHMLAVLGTQPGAPPLFGAFTPPRVSVAGTADDSAIAEPAQSVYDRGSWPHSAEAQLEIVCRMLEGEENRLREQETELEAAVAQARRREAEFEERTAWALQLNRRLNTALFSLAEKNEEIAVGTAWARRLDEELAGKTAWAMRLESDLAERTELALRLEREIRRLEGELAARTAWAMRMESELAERTDWALRLDRELAGRTAWARRVEGELAERTDWALTLDRELTDRTAWARGLERQVADRTAWAMQLETELADRTEWALRLDRELAERLQQTAPRRTGIAGYLSRLFSRRGAAIKKP